MAIFPHTTRGRPPIFTRVTRSDLDGQPPRVLGPEHPDTLLTRGELAAQTGEAGDAARAATSTPPCCPSSSGSKAPSTRTPWWPAPPWPTGQGRPGTGRGPRAVRRPAAPPRAGPGPRAPGHVERTRQPRLLDRGGGRRSPWPRVWREVAHRCLRLPRRTRACTRPGAGVPNARSWLTSERGANRPVDRDVVCALGPWRQCGRLSEWLTMWSGGLGGQERATRRWL